jgi:TolB-like protein
LSASEDIRKSKGRRLDSWKAIAQYLDRDLRSVQRWEHERALPVHRMPGEKGAVFAYEGELESWLHSRENAARPSEPRSSPVAIAEAPPAARGPGRWRMGIVAAAVMVLLGGLAMLRWEALAPPPRTPTAPPRRSLPGIAVLPMLNLSGDRAEEFFADGFTDELVTELAQIRALRVISRTSTMVYKGSRKPLPEIARELGVKYVLEGSVAREGGRVRVIAQLIDAPADTHIAARTYDGDVKDVFDIQSRISRAIAQDVRLDLSPDERARLASVHEVDPVAHDLYLKACYEYARQTPDSIRQSLALYQAAVAKAPSFAAAYVGIAQAEYALLTITAQSPDETVPRIREALARALAFDPHLGEAHGLLAVLIYWRDRNWPEAEREYRLALAEGAQSQTQRHFGLDLVTRGRFEEGSSHLQTAVDLDPLGMAPRMSEFFGYYFQRKYADARRATDEALKLDPDFMAAHVVRGLVATIQRDCPETSAEAAWVGKHFPSPLAEFESVLLDVCRGDNPAARAGLARMAASKGPSFASPYQMALGYAAIENKVAALSYIAKSVDAHEGQATYLKVEPLFDSIRSDPRFVAQEKRVGLLP